MLRSDNVRATFPRILTAPINKFGGLLIVLGIITESAGSTTFIIIGHKLLVRFKRICYIQSVGNFSAIFCWYQLHGPAITNFFERLGQFSAGGSCQSWHCVAVVFVVGRVDEWAEIVVLLVKSLLIFGLPASQKIIDWALL